MLAPRFQLFGTFIPDNANAGGSAICIHKELLPDDAVVTHVVTCQGRDHIVNVWSGCQSLVIVNAHFEPELTLRSLRERQRLITPHWPHYPDAIGTIMGDFNIFASQRKEDSMFGIRLSPMVTRKRLLYFMLYFLTFSKLPSLIIQRETPQSMGLYARCPGLIKLLSIFLRQKRATSIAAPMLLRTWRKGPLYVWLFKNRLFGDTRANAFRVGCPNVPFSAQL